MVKNPLVLEALRKTSIGVIIAIIFSVYPIPAFAQNTNAGIINGVWFSTPNIVENVPVKIYTAILNESPKNISGTISFFQGSTKIGDADFAATANQIIRIDITHTFTKGTQKKVTAKITSIKGDLSLTYLDTETKSSEIIVDIDTDSDSIGDNIDEDDDNDGLTDTYEVEIGTNPKIKDNPQDNIKDKFLTRETQSSVGDFISEGASVLDDTGNLIISIVDPIKEGIENKINETITSLTNPKRVTKKPDTAIDHLNEIHKIFKIPEVSWLNKLSAIALTLINVGLEWWIPVLTSLSLYLLWRRFVKKKDYYK